MKDVQAGRWPIRVPQAVRRVWPAKPSIRLEDGTVSIICFHDTEYWQFYWCNGLRERPICRQNHVFTWWGWQRPTPHPRVHGPSPFHPPPPPPCGIWSSFRDVTSKSTHCKTTLCRFVSPFSLHYGIFLHQLQLQMPGECGMEASACARAPAQARPCFRVPAGSVATKSPYMGHKSRFQ